MFYKGIEHGVYKDCVNEKFLIEENRRGKSFSSYFLIKMYSEISCIHPEPMKLHGRIFFRLVTHIENVGELIFFQSNEKWQRYQQ